MVLKKVANEGADQQEGAEGGAVSAVPSGPDRKKVLTSKKVQNQKLVLLEQPEPEPEEGTGPERDLLRYHLDRSVYFGWH